MFGFKKKENSEQPIVVANVEPIDEESLNRGNKSKKKQIVQEEEEYDEITAMESKIAKLKAEKERIKSAINKPEINEEEEIIELEEKTPQVIIKPQVVSVEQMMNILFERQEILLERQEVLDVSLRKVLDYIKSK